MDNLKQLIANRLRAARESAGYTQAEIADLLKIERGSYTQIETGTNALRLEHLVKLCAILDRSSEYFLGMPAKGLPKDESELLELYRALPADSKPLTLATLRAWLELQRQTPEPGDKSPPEINTNDFKRLDAVMKTLTVEERTQEIRRLAGRRAARITRGE